MIKKIKPIKYVLTLNETELEELKKIYGIEGNYEAFFTLIIFNPKIARFEAYLTKREYKIYKKLKGDKK